MLEFLKTLNDLNYLKQFNKICINVASPNKIRTWSYGEIKNTKTINYRNFKPENDGLFCAKIFGPVEDYHCLCGKYKLNQYQNVICTECGVETIASKVRRERMGHIELAVPMVHIWYFKALPSRIGLLLNMSLRDLERIIYFDAYIITHSDIEQLKVGQLIAETSYELTIENYEIDDFEAKIGGEAIYELLRNINLVTEQEILKKLLNTTNSKTIKTRLLKRLKLIQALIKSNTQPEWMLLTVLPVLPPDLRPLIPLDDAGRFIISDLNSLYSQIILRNNRAKYLLEIHAPTVVLYNELRLLQQSVDNLFNNASKLSNNSAKVSLQSLSKMIKGKQGQFRQNLLGKRVDYSGRSVMVANPQLELHQCGLPKIMALELFKPFLLCDIKQNGFAISIQAAKKLIRQKPLIIWDILAKTIKQHPIILNKIPSLSRLNIQAFEPILIETKAIQLHPLIYQIFSNQLNELAVYIPLTIEAQLESSILMMPSNNLLSTLNGQVFILPPQEAILGLYYLTYQDVEDNQPNFFAHLAEVQLAYETGFIKLHSPIKLLIETTNNKKMRVETTVGRALLSQYLPENLAFELINHCLTAPKIYQLLNTCFQYITFTEIAIFIRQLTNQGFKYATKLGISISMDNLLVTEFSNLIEMEQKPNSALNAKNYFIMAAHLRKQLTSINIAMANAGYLMRRLIDVVQDEIITELDCQTNQGIFISALIGEENKVIKSLRECLLGRVTAANIFIPKTKELLIKSNTLLTEDNINNIEKYNIQPIKVRSSIACQARWGICAQCYGKNLTSRKIVNTGEAVGIVAAQSIGESCMKIANQSYLNAPISKIDNTIANKQLYYLTDLLEARPPKTTSQSSNEMVNLHDILNIQGVNEFVNFFIMEIQIIFAKYGINISNKHLEVVIGQMLKTVKIIQPRASSFFKDEIVNYSQLQQENQRIMMEHGQNQIATYVPNLLGITKASLSKKSYLAVASFMDTTRILLDNAVNGQCDKLQGIKENTMVGRLPPVGTGFIDL